MADNIVCQNLREVESILKEKKNRSRGEDCGSKQGLALEHLSPGVLEHCMWAGLLSKGYRVELVECTQNCRVDHPSTSTL
jgi:hypothetical protein